MQFGDLGREMLSFICDHFVTESLVTGTLLIESAFHPQWLQGTLLDKLALQLVDSAMSVTNQRVQLSRSQLTTFCTKQTTQLTLQSNHKHSSVLVLNMPAYNVHSLPVLPI